MKVDPHPVAVRISRDPSLPTYPVVLFLARFGRAFAYALAALMLLAGGWGYALTGQALVMLAAAAGALVVAVLLLSYVEVLRIMADTLMPR